MPPRDVTATTAPKTIAAARIAPLNAGESDKRGFNVTASSDRSLASRRRTCRQMANQR